MKKFYLLLLLFTSLCFGQEYHELMRIYKTDNSFIDCRKITEKKDRTDYETYKEGKFLSIANSKVSYIRSSINTDIAQFEYKNKKLVTPKVFDGINFIKAKEIFERSKEWAGQKYRDLQISENKSLQFKGVQAKGISLSPTQYYDMSTQ